MCCLYLYDTPFCIRCQENAFDFLLKKGKKQKFTCLLAIAGRITLIYIEKPLFSQKKTSRKPENLIQQIRKIGEKRLSGFRDVYRWKKFVLDRREIFMDCRNQGTLTSQLRRLRRKKDLF